MAIINRQFTLAARPVGFPRESDFRLVESPLPSPGAGEVLVRANFLSVDPYMRGRMNDRQSYARPVAIGEVMTGEIVGRIVASNHDRFGVGDVVAGRLGWQQYAISDGSDLRPVDPDVAPISTALGVLGMPAMTAYFGLLEIGKAQRGETVVVSGAAGAVGSVVGQIAKIHGCRVVGIAGSDEKVDYLTGELGFDDAFNYKTTANYVERLAVACPQGIDVYFDNVGGAITDAVLLGINVGARIAICGQISQYNLEKPQQGPRRLWKLIEKQARIEGFLVFQFADRFRDAIGRMAGWVSTGELKYREHVVEGFENAPGAFIGMLHGENIGKQIVKIADD